MRILIADDSKFILDRLEQMLKGLEDVDLVGCFQNGTDALNSLRILKPDLAVLDNKMPGLKGMDIIKEIRKENATVKLILLTLYSNSYYRRQALKSGADYFFSKSEEFEKIPELITELIKNEEDVLLLD